MKFRIFSSVVAMVLLGGMAAAQSSVEGIISDLQSQGFTSFEVKNGATQSKVEAVRGTEQVEIVIDRASGAVLSTEVGVASARDQGRVGISVRDRSNRDFTRANRSSDDNPASSRNRSRSGDDSSRSRSSEASSRSRGSDDSGRSRGSDDSGRSRGGDDHGADDHGGDRGGRGRGRDD
ncbi:MAG: hypothetical protein EBS68_01835 [Rhodobacteraceae bacterium]|jgi:hypothetical protein|nr:hypothetical protein [Paracoccaceae bacterium]